MENFSEFQQKVLSGNLNTEQIFQKYFVDSSTYYFESDVVDKDLEYQLKSELSDILGVHVNDIYIIGSAKTGFSIKPRAIGRPFDGKFTETNRKNDRSDIDIAIVSSDLFEKIQENIYDWTNGFVKSWDRNNYYHDGGSEKFGVTLKFKFLEYLGKGWYRPDFCPVGYKIPSKGALQIDEVFGLWRRKLDRKIAYAVYKNWNFFKKYQMENISKIKSSIESGEEL